MYRVSPICYRTVNPCRGSYARVRLRNGRWHEGRITAVRPDGFVLHSPNPGFFFIPFFTAAVLLAATIPFYGYRRGFRRGFYY